MFVPFSDTWSMSKCPSGNLSSPGCPVGPRPYGTCTGDDGLEATAARQPDGQAQTVMALVTDPFWCFLHGLPLPPLRFMSGRCRQRLSLVCSHTESVVDSCSCLAHVIEVVLNCSPNDVVPKLKDGLGRLMGALRCPAGPHVGGFRIYLSFYNIVNLLDSLVVTSMNMAMNNPPICQNGCMKLQLNPIEHIVLFLCTVCWKISLRALGLQVEVCRSGRAAEDSSKWHPDLYFPGRIEASWSLSHRPQVSNKIQATKLGFADEKKLV